MFHLSRFQQHHIHLAGACEYTCLGCNHVNVHEQIALPDTAKPGDWLNIYGGGIHRSSALTSLLINAKKRRLNARLFGNHHLLLMPPSVLAAVDELMIWCPSPSRKEFNFMVSEPLFNEFKKALNNNRQPNVTLVNRVRPLGFEVLPEFYDLCVEVSMTGLILYLPLEFNREQRRYIDRFKRVPGMRVLKQANTTSEHCFAVPVGINGLGFEFFEWRNALRQSLRQLPILGRIF
ncbi:MAG: hypothetical protein VW397_04005 [Candidatus Margulisiibacteriota bacterium]